MNQKGVSSIVILLIIIGVLVIAGGIWAWQSQKEKPVVCTQDTKLCPDGSYVSRAGLNCEFATCPEVKDETADWKTFSSATLGISFKYPNNYIIMDRLSGEEKAILLGDKEFPKPDIAPWYHAPITMSLYEASKINDQTSALANVKRSTIVIDGQSANVIEGNYPDYPVPGAVANNHMKIITISNKNLTITAQDSYAGTKSDWNNLSSALDNILGTIKFK